MLPDPEGACMATLWVALKFLSILKASAFVGYFCSCAYDIFVDHYVFKFSK